MRDFSDGRERAPVQRARTVPAQRRKVCSSAVAFVLFKIILWIFLCRLLHEAVTGDLGDDAGGCNRKTDRVALHDGYMGNRKIRNRPPVDQNNVGLRIQRERGPSHGCVSGLQDVHRINLRHIRHHYAPDQIVAGCQFLVYSITLFFGELLRVVQASVFKSIGQNHSRDTHRSGQRTSPRFVDACDAPMSTLSPCGFMIKGGTGHSILIAASRT